MNSIHDMGGMHGFGAIVREEDEPTFHGDWEKRVWAMVMAVRRQGLFNIDEFRHGIERMLPAEYLASSYYERWLGSTLRLLTEKGFISEKELENKQTKTKDFQNINRYSAAEMLEAMQKGGSAMLPAENLPPRFKVGDKVRVDNANPLTHTRNPRYVRGKSGIIHRLHDTYIFPDANAHGSKQPEHLYTVRFSAREIWGEEADPHDSVYVDLFESYLNDER
jgi:nitrile hydratase subunit beta